MELRSSEALSAFLDGFKVQGKQGRFTHISPDPCARFLIPDEDLDELREMYNKHVEAGGRICLQEMPEEFGPWLIDADMKMKSKGRKYTEEHLLFIMRLALKLLMSKLNRRKRRKVLGAVALEKSGPRLENAKDGSTFYKDGFHIHILCSLNKRSRAWLTRALAKKLDSSKELAELWERVGKPASDVIDSNIETKAWHMHGSSKAMDMEPYLATFFMDADGVLKESKEELLGEDVDLTKALSIREHEADGIGLRETELEKMVRFMPERKKTKPPTNRTDVEVTADIALIRKANFLGMLDDKMADDYDDWMRIGWILYNICQGSQIGLDMWIEFSQRSEKFVDGVCEYEWDRMVAKGMTIGSLMYFAQKCSPEKYEQWKRTSIEGLQNTLLKNKKVDTCQIASILFLLYKNKFVCANLIKDVWYRFDNHVWRKIPAGLDLRTILNEEIYKQFRDLQDKYNREAFAEETNPHAKTLRDRCEAIMLALHTPKCQRDIIFHAQTMFYDKNFMKKIDMNLKVFAVQNGVLDLETLKFRDGAPEDFCSLAAGCDYNPNLGWDDQNVMAVQELLGKVHVDPELRDCYLQSYACCLEGGNVNKVCMVHNGDDGSNAKTTMANFMADVFGDYAQPLNAEVLVAQRGRNGSSGPKPELVRLRGVRLAQTPELGKNEPINLGMFKTLTSVDMMFLRNLFDGDGENIRPTHTLHVQLNELPPVHHSDQAFWDRVMVLPYESFFVQRKHAKLYKVSKSTKRQYAMKRFKADETLSSKMEHMVPAMLWILFERYKTYKIDGFVVPDKVRVASEKYRAENDMYQQFFSDTIDAGEDTDFVPCTELYKCFKAWKEEKGASKMNISSVVFSKEMSNKKFMGLRQKKKMTEGWYGFRIRTDDEENGKDETTSE